MPTRPSRSRHRIAPLVIVVGLASVVLVAGLLVLFDRGVGPLPGAERCRARAGGTTVDLSLEQPRTPR